MAWAELAASVAGWIPVYVPGDGIWDFSLLTKDLPRTVGTAVTLFFAGVLANAAGIGGGGIFVAILLFFMDLTPYDAIPLSKSLIFTGSVMSFVASYRRVHEVTGKPLLSFPLVKNIVPMAIVGTLFGVFFNVRVPAFLIVVCLSLLLGLMTIRTWVATIGAFRREQALLRRPRPQPVSSILDSERQQSLLDS